MNQTKLALILFLFLSGRGGWWTLNIQQWVSVHMQIAAIIETLRSGWMDESGL